jgi:hypothetical protein
VFVSKPGDAIPNHVYIHTKAAMPKKFYSLLTTLAKAVRFQNTMINMEDHGKLNTHMGKTGQWGLLFCWLDKQHR